MALISILNAHFNTQVERISAILISQYKSLFFNRRVVYKVGRDRVRHVVGTFNYKDSDLTRCVGSNPYPDFSARFGYLHSFAMSENYIILPETALMDDPCVFSKSVWDLYPKLPFGNLYKNLK